MQYWGNKKCPDAQTYEADSIKSRMDRAVTSGTCAGGDFPIGNLLLSEIMLYFVTVRYRNLHST